MEVWNKFIAAADSFFDLLKKAVSGSAFNIEAYLNTLAEYGTYIIVGSFLLLFVYNAFIKRSNSIKHMKKVRSLVICGILIALNCVLSLYSPNIGRYIEINLGFITIPAAAFMFGPITGCIVGIVQDIVSFVIKPTGVYLPMLTIIPGISAMIYGMFFYKKDITFTRVFLAKIIINVFVHILLNSLALAPIMDKGIAYYLPARVIKNFAVLPFETIVLYYFLMAVKKTNISLN